MLTAATRAAAAIAVLCATTRAQAPASRTSLDQLLDLAQQRTLELRAELPTAISDEHYVQKVAARSGSVVSRTIESEMLFIWPPGNETWMAVRNVHVVDRQPIADTTDWLDRIFMRPESGMLSRLRELQAESARFDVGPVSRSVGSPTLAVQVLLPAHRSRFVFKDAGAETVNGSVVRKVGFEETARPAEIVINGEPVPSSGILWLRAEDGVIVRTNLKVQSTTFGRAVIDVELSLDRTLRAWLPFRMEEQYEPRRGDSVSCVSRYSNFRKFEAAGRIASAR